MLPNETRISQNQWPPRDTETRIRWAVKALLQCSSLSSISDTIILFLSMVVHPQWMEGITTVGIQDSLLLLTVRCNLHSNIKGNTAMVGMEHLRATECQISEWTPCNRCQEPSSLWWTITECHCKELQFQELAKVLNILSIQMEQSQIRLDSITLLLTNNQWV